MAVINGKKIEIHLKGGFSERKGIKHFSEIVQVNSLSERTRNKIYTAIKDVFELINNYSEAQDYVIEYIYEELFSLTQRDIPRLYMSASYSKGNVFEQIYTVIIEEDYSDVLTFIEGIIKCFAIIDSSNGSRLNLKNRYIEIISYIFQSENVNYRIIDDKITDIVDENQIASIEETINNPYKVVTEHYSKAIEQLYSVKDYANSIKESISSVEAMCQVINGSKEELNKALKNLKITIHPALEQAYIKLYAYTCDENGSRHANGIGEKNATFEEAKYMLISCSAFVNYLKENFKEGK